MQVRARILIINNKWITRPTGSQFRFHGGIFLLVNRKGELLWKCEKIVDYSSVKLIVLKSLERVHIYYPLIEKTSNKYIAPGRFLPYEEGDLVL